MNITIERSHPINKGKFIAFVDVCIEGIVILRGCKILMGQNNGRFVGMPSTLNPKTSKYDDHVKFKTRELQDEFSHLVISAYEGNSGSSKPAPVAAPAGASADSADPANINWEE